MKQYIDVEETKDLSPEARHQLTGWLLENGDAAKHFANPRMPIGQMTEENLQPLAMMEHDP